MPALAITHSPRAPRPIRRGPGIGYNHNFRRRGREFHIQTEDSGARHPHINTHVFHQGVVIASKRTHYDPAEVRSTDAVVKLMQTSHKAMCSALAKGELDQRIASRCGGQFLEATVEDQGPAPLSPAVTLGILSRLERTVEGFLGAAIIDQETGTVVHSIEVQHNLREVSESSAEVLRATKRTLEKLHLDEGVEDILLTAGDDLFILRPVCPRLFVYVVTDRRRANLALSRHQITLAAEAIREDT